MDAREVQSQEETRARGWEAKLLLKPWSKLEDGVGGIPHLEVEGMSKALSNPRWAPVGIGDW